MRERERERPAVARELRPVWSRNTNLRVWVHAVTARKSFDPHIDHHRPARTRRVADAPPTGRLGRVKAKQRADRTTKPSGTSDDVDGGLRKGQTPPDAKTTPKTSSTTVRTSRDAPQRRQGLDAHFQRTRTGEQTWAIQTRMALTLRYTYRTNYHNDVSNSGRERKTGTERQKRRASTPKKARNRHTTRHDQ